MSVRLVPVLVRTRVVPALAAVAVAVSLAPAGVASAHAGTSAPGDSTAGTATASVPSALTIAKRMARHDGVYMSNPGDEGPTTVVLGGLCTRLAAGGCQRMLATDDASVMVFDTAVSARLYAGAADDDATAFGRMVLSFGSPARVRPARQGAYEKAIRAFRRQNPAIRNHVVPAVEYVAARGLPMRDPRFEDSRGERLGRASEIPGAVDMVATDQADVIVFAGRRSAELYVGAADDVTYRLGRVVLSYGSPPRVVKSVRPDYERALRRALG